MLWLSDWHTLQVSEDQLYNEFAVFGAVRSIKIMWPRTDEEKMRCHTRLACMAVDFFGLYGCDWCSQGVGTVASCRLKTGEPQNRPLDRWMEKMCKDQQ